MKSPLPLHQLLTFALLMACSSAELKDASSSAGGKKADKKETESEKEEIAAEDSEEGLEIDEPVWVNAAYLTCAWGEPVSETESAVECVAKSTAASGLFDATWTLEDDDGTVLETQETPGVQVPQARTYKIATADVPKRTVAVAIKTPKESRKLALKLKVGLPDLAEAEVDAAAAAPAPAAAPAAVAPPPVLKKGRWYRVTPQACPAFCTGRQLTNVKSPDGAMCASAEMRPASAYATIEYTTYCGNCPPDTRPGLASVGKLCYGTTQVRDNDPSDSTLGCFCE